MKQHEWTKLGISGKEWICDRCSMLSFGEFPDPSDTCRGNVSERILRECDRANTLRVVDVEVTK